MSLDQIVYLYSKALSYISISIILYLPAEKSIVLYHDVHERFIE